METESLKVYDQVIIRVFESVFVANADHLPFSKADIERAIRELGLQLSTRNVPDIVYTYRSGRSDLPEFIMQYGSWAIEGKGKSKYAFRKLACSPYFDIPSDIEITKIPDATPQIVLKYQSSDEQAILARIRHNRLLDIFTSLTTYHLQGHFRTAVAETGQIEIDDLYIGLDTDGNGFILPIEAKVDSAKDQLGVIQVTQMVRFAKAQFPDLMVRPIGLKLLSDGSYMFLEFTAVADPNQIATKRYKRYLLVQES
ncbi:MAG: hypothetical protein H6658_08955 [Ardenticatenaceae bacterium]|nr:hypothetical protein [Ardenticatenaceae bacterium]